MGFSVIECCLLWESHMAYRLQSLWLYCFLWNPHAMKEGEQSLERRVLLLWLYLFFLLMVLQNYLRIVALYTWILLSNLYLSFPATGASPFLIFSSLRLLKHEYNIFLAFCKINYKDRCIGRDYVVVGIRGKIYLALFQSIYSHFWQEKYKTKSKLFYQKMPWIKDLQRKVWISSKFGFVEKSNCSFSDMSKLIRQKYS